MLNSNKKNFKEIEKVFLPIVISIIGPKKVGKTTLIKSLASYFLYTHNEFSFGPLVILVENKISYLFIESPPDVLSVSNLTKISDVIILAIDGYFGLELEIFEFVSFFNIHGASRILAVFTHIDLFSSWKNLKRSKKRMKNRLKKEIKNCIKIFFLNGINIEERYFPREISNITRFFSHLIIRPSLLQKSLPYVIITRLDLELNKVKTNIILSGFQKGKYLGEISISEGFMPGIGKVVLKKIKKCMPLKKKKNLFNFYKTEQFGRITKKFKDLNQKFNKNNKKVFMFNFFILFKYDRKNKLYKKLFEIICSDKFKPGQKFYKNKNEKINMEKKILSSNYLNLVDSLDLTLKKEYKKSIHRQKDNFIRIIIDELCEHFYRYFDFTFPLFLCIDVNKQSRITITKAIVYRHKWNKKVIQTRDIIFLSIGWKFFEASVFFFKEKPNKKAYSQKCLSFNRYSFVCFLAQSEPPGTGIVGILNPGNNFCSYHKGTLFNIIFTGSITNEATDFKLFKKIKLKGVIFKSFKKTCYVKNMFFNEVEIVRFMQSFVYDSFGNKGIIKKSTKTGPPGSFRAFFEKNTQNGDFVFLKLLIPIKLNKKIKNSNFFSIPSDFKEIKFILKK